MPVPTAISALSQTAASNSPATTESPTSADDYLRQYSAFIAMLRDGIGFTDPVQLASGATTSIGAQNSLFVEITGTTTITSFGTSYEGPRFLRFTGALQLTHNATTLNLPGAANITTTAGDTAIAIPNQAGNGWNVYAYQRADGTPLAITAATQAQQETATSTTTVVTPGRQQYHPSASKAWGRLTQSAGTYTLGANYGVASISKLAVGSVRVTLSTAMSSTDYAVVGSMEGSGFSWNAFNRTTTTFDTTMRNGAGSDVDGNFSFIVMGDQ